MLHVFAKYVGTCMAIALLLSTVAIALVLFA